MSHITAIKLASGATYNVPSDLSEKLQRAHAVMQSQGYTCNASWEGFAAGAAGETYGAQPYSIVTNIIENRRWANGFEKARNAVKRRVRILGGKGDYFLRCEENAEVVGSGFKRREDAIRFSDTNGWYSI